jgi:hypothetical protein
MHVAELDIKYNTVARDLGDLCIVVNSTYKIVPVGGEGGVLRGALDIHLYILFLDGFIYIHTTVIISPK